MIRTERISFRIGEFRLQETSIEVAEGEYFVLLGPPGSGKTVFLECLCGLKRPASGRIFLGDREVTALEPRRRKIGYVPQDYALFPHLSVERNIRFGLQVRREARDVMGRTVDAVTEMLGIRHLLKRGVSGLSGGERQRVALARALAMGPKVLLLDEPVSTLDEATREAVCGELRRVQRELSMTTIHVSHHLEEAFSVADRAGILHKGRFVQTGALEALLRKPESEFVAAFMRCENVFTGEAVGPGDVSGTTAVRVGDVAFPVTGQHTGTVKFIIRPEHVHLVRKGASVGGETGLALTLDRLGDRGAYVRAELAGRVRLVAHLSHAAFAELGSSIGAEVTAVVRQETIHVLPV